MGDPLRRPSKPLVSTLVVVSFATLASAALPPGHGGSLRLPASAPLSIPEAGVARTPLEATLADAVYDPPSALGAITHDDEGATVLTLREGTRRHDRRPLIARDVVTSLQRLERSDSGWWLSAVARRRGRLDASAVDGRTVVLRPASEGVDLAPLLASRALGVEVGVGTGTGAFRPRRVGEELRLFQFRSAARGAPRLQSVILSPPRTREAELRAFELDELDASWLGASVYGGTPPRPVTAHRLGSGVPVLLVPHPSRRVALRGLSRILDRRRLARVGLEPTDHLEDALPSPAPTGDGAVSGSWTLIHRDGDLFASELARALAATLDDRGVQLQIVAVDDARWDVALRGRYDLRIEQVVPMAEGAPMLLASALAAAGDRERAGRIVARALAGETNFDADCRALPALVLGRRTPTLYARASYAGVRTDALGRVILGDIFLPRAETTP